MMGIPHCQRSLKTTKPREQALAILNNSLQDPLNPTLCGRTLEYLLDILGGDIPCLCCCVATEIAFLPTLLAFLLTPFNMTALNERLGRCKCNFMDALVRSIHLKAPRKSPFLLETVVRQLFYLAYHLLLRLKPGKAHLVTSCTSGKRISIDWLRNIANLLPAGPEMAVQGLEEWSKFLKTYTPTQVFCVLCHHCPSLLIHAEGFFAHNIIIAESIAHNLRDPQWDASQPHHAAAEHQIQALFEFFNILTEDYAKDSDGLPIFPYDAHRIFKMTRDIYSCLGHVNYSCLLFERERVQIAFFMKKLWLDPLNIDWGQKEMIAEEVLDVLNKGPNEYCCEGDFDLPVSRRHINCLMEEAMEGPRCGYFDCHNTVESTGEPFRRCSGCSVARYCSIECQRASWKALGMHSHKSICATLKKLKSVRQKRGEFHKIPGEYLRDDNFSDEEINAVTAYFKRQQDWDFYYGSDSDV